MLRATKHLEAHPDRPFAALRVTRGRCHAEGNEASRGHGDRPFADEVSQNNPDIDTYIEGR